MEGKDFKVELTINNKKVGLKPYVKSVFINVKTVLKIFGSNFFPEFVNVDRCTCLSTSAIHISK